MHLAPKFGKLSEGKGMLWHERSLSRNYSRRKWRKTNVVMVLRVRELELTWALSTTEYATYIGISFVLFLMATLASYVPARRAAQVSPVTVLHNE